MMRRRFIGGLALAPWLALADGGMAGASPFSGLYQGQAYVPVGSSLDLSPGMIRQTGPLLVSVWLSKARRLERRNLGGSPYAFQVSVRLDRQEAHVLKTLYQADQRVQAQAGERLSITVSNLSAVELDLSFKISPSIDSRPGQRG